MNYYKVGMNYELHMVYIPYHNNEKGICTMHLHGSQPQIPVKGYTWLQGRHTRITNTMNRLVLSSFII